MPHKTRLTLVILVLAAAALACTLLPATETPDVVATRVAETLAAGGETADPETEEPTVAPDTAPPPTPTPTPMPRQFVYAADGNVQLWVEGGSPTTLTSSGDVRAVKIADDGQVIAFIRQVDDTHDEIWAVNADGSDLRMLVSAGDFDALTDDPDTLTTRVHSFDFVPGSHTIAYNTRPIFEGPGLILNNDLRLVDADTAGQSTLLPPGQGGEFVYAPDGSQVAVISPTQISFVNADGSNRRDALSFPTVLTYSEYQFYPRPVWTPDGSAVRVVIPPHASLDDPTPPTKLWHVPADGSSPTELFSFTPSPFFLDVAALSPDAGQVAYLQPVGGDDTNRELHLANADGSRDTTYDTGQLVFEAWSTDGGHFIYSREGENPRIGQLGSAPQPISGINRIRDVRWPNATQYLYLNRDSGNWELWLGELGATNTLIDSAADSISYDFTP